MRNLIVIMLLTSCSPSIYYVATDSDFEQVQYQPVKKKIIYLSQEMAPLDRLDSTANLINKKKWKKFDHGVRAFSEKDQLFLRSVKYLIEENYTASFNALDSLNDYGHDCQVALLKTDCLYELHVDSVDLKSQYQQALNCAETEVIKSIIKTRYRFLRYDQ